ncbi:MAG TPA: hypothetical protein VJ437_10360 [Acidiferrobacterales bacterium]|nr:hypothetical protein [Acidiferrobacterales bacterium]
MRKPRQYTFICLNNTGYKASLEKRKIYIALADDEAAKHGLVRIVDESGEDYLYPLKLFAQVDLPPRVQRAVLMVA